LTARVTAFDPIQIGQLPLPNRIAMAPMTRSRAAANGLATALMARYYAQRASAGLIITEGIQPSLVGQGYPSTPGLHTVEQVMSWRAVIDAVHAAGGRIYAQLLHTGRIGHPDLLPDGLIPVAPSAIAAHGTVVTPHGRKELLTPRELRSAEVDATVNDYADAARNAIDAGFDGVEVHGANGYLVHQFLAAATNLRTDEWGGSVHNRIRFAVEVVRGIAHTIGAHRTALRISPGNPFNDMTEPDVAATYCALVEQLRPIGLAYLHLVEVGDRALTNALRTRYGGAFMLNPHTGPQPTGTRELQLIENGTADLISYGALFLANPDLPQRLARGGPYNRPHRESFYGGDERGYTDYSILLPEPGRDTTSRSSSATVTKALVTPSESTNSTS
jgi:N-ethylmaleimide reductase